MKGDRYTDVFMTTKIVKNSIALAKYIEELSLRLSVTPWSLTT